MKIQYSRVLIHNTIQKQYKIHANTRKYNTKYNIILVYSILSYILPWGAKKKTYTSLSYGGGARAQADSVAARLEVPRVPRHTSRKGGHRMREI